MAFLGDDRGDTRVSSTALGVLSEALAMGSSIFSFCAVALAAAAAVTACGHDDYHHGYRRGDGSSIVFGISEGKDAASGKTVTTAGHEYLSLANRGGSKTQVDFVSDGDVCIHEELDRRIGRPNVGDGGRARFTGGKLPGDGIVIDANGKEEPKVDGESFFGDQPLSFAVDFGFALPEFGVVRLPSPNRFLEIKEPQETGELGVDVTKDTAVAWSPTMIQERPTSRGRARVMVAFETDDAQDHGNQVRCFYDEADGAGIVPSKWLSLIGPKGTKGTVTYASHRQVDVYARGGWLIYVVGTIVLREQRFVVN